MDDMHDIIDKNNNVIAVKKRCELAQGDMVRFVHIYIFDKNNNFVVQQRAEGRSRPNLLDPSAGGHVDAGETFEIAAHRELKEELGIETELEYVCDSWGDYGFCKVYKGTYNGSFSPNSSEVKTVDKIPFFELISLHRKYAYLFQKGFQDSFKKYLETIYPAFDMVDKNDKIIGQCRYDDIADIRDQEHYVRVVHVLLRNKKGELLFQQRSKNVAIPMILDDAATGHVDKGESYKQAAEREVFEELGIKINLNDVEPFFYQQFQHNKKFGQAFIVDYEGELSPENDEVANLVWLSLDDIKMMQRKTPFLFTKSSLETHAKYKKFIEKQEVL